MPSSPRIVFSARALVARRLPFARRRESYADVEVARDEIRALPPAVEPLILRVRAAGFSLEDRARVEGDWFCDVTGQEPVKLPPPRWEYEGGEASAWVQGKTWLAAWETCTRPDWMMHGAASAGVARKSVARVACVAARSVLGLVPAGEDRPRALVERAEAWTQGRVETQAVIDLAQALPRAYGTPEAGYLAQAIVQVFEACRSAAYIAYPSLGPDNFGSYAAYAFDHAAMARAHARCGPRAKDMRVCWRQTMPEFAHVVRRELPTVEVFRALARSTHADT